MGVQTDITLQEVRHLFANYAFTTLQATKEGVMDTTYLLDNFILKRYERDISFKVEQDAAMLEKLHTASLNVPLLVDANEGWYLYRRLKGSVPQNTHYYHIQALARFMAKMHQVNYKQIGAHNFLDTYNLHDIETFTKNNFFFF